MCVSIKKQIKINELVIDAEISLHIDGSFNISHVVKDEERIESIELITIDNNSDELDINFVTIEIDKVIFKGIVSFGGYTNLGVEVI